MCMRLSREDQLLRAGLSSQVAPFATHATNVICKHSHTLHTALPFSLTHITNSAGDRLLVIDGVNVEGKKPADVSSMIVGPSVSEHKHLPSNYSPNRYCYISNRIIVLMLE